MWLTLSAADAPALTLGYLGVNAVGDHRPRYREQRAARHRDRRRRCDLHAVRASRSIRPAWSIQVWQGNQPHDLDAGGQFRPRRPQRYGLCARSDGRHGDVRRRHSRPTPARRCGDRRADIRLWRRQRRQSRRRQHQGDPAGRSARCGTRWPTIGGSDGESVADAERRIPAFLANRDRAVTVGGFSGIGARHARRRRLGGPRWCRG